jgi:hypothetical protein
VIDSLTEGESKKRAILLGYRSISEVSCWLSSNGEKFVRSWCCQGWVFRGWVGASRQYKRESGEYLGREDLVALSKMNRRVRDGEFEWLVSTGYRSSSYVGLGACERRAVM